MWWTQSLSVDRLDCTDDELATFLDKAIALRRHPTQEDSVTISSTTDTGIVSRINGREYTGSNYIMHVYAIS